MRIIADESCDFAIIRGLRDAGYDVMAVAESMAGSSDERVIEVATSERKLLITEDKDFGQLVFAAATKSSGIILVRYPALARSVLVRELNKLLSERGNALYDLFVVLEPGRTRIASR